MRKFDGTNRDQLTASYAYQLWQERGSPMGSPEVDWFAAEKAIDAESSLFGGDIRFPLLRWNLMKAPGNDLSAIEAVRYFRSLPDRCPSRKPDSIFS